MRFCMLSFDVLLAALAALTVEISTLEFSLCSGLCARGFATSLCQLALASVAKDRNRQRFGKEGRKMWHKGACLNYHVTIKIPFIFLGP